MVYGGIVVHHGWWFNDVEWWSLIFWWLKKLHPSAVVAGWGAARTRAPLCIVRRGRVPQWALAAPGGRIPSCEHIHMGIEGWCIWSWLTIINQLYWIAIINHCIANTNDHQPPYIQKLVGEWTWFSVAWCGPDHICIVHNMHWPNMLFVDCIS